MFNRTFIANSPDSIDVTVTEHRAPTDESVRLLKEMERAAEAKVLASIHVADQKFECVIHHMSEVLTGQERFGAVFKLNGKQMQVERSISYLKLGDDPLATVATMMRDAVAEAIANDISRAFAVVGKESAWVRRAAGNPIGARQKPEAA